MKKTNKINSSISENEKINYSLKSPSHQEVSYNISNNTIKNTGTIPKIKNTLKPPEIRNRAGPHKLPINQEAINCNIINSNTKNKSSTALTRSKTSNTNNTKI